MIGNSQRVSSKCQNGLRGVYRKEINVSAYCVL